jgi:rhomboid protease GluP
MEAIKSFLTEIRYGSSATYTLIAINILIFLAVNYINLRFAGASDTELAQVFGGSAYILVIGNSEWWRLITSAFLHISWWHILMNMFALHSFGTFLENFYSLKKIFIVYILCGISGSALALFDFGAITLGASGAIFGLMGLVIGNLLKRNTYSPGLPIKMDSVLYPALIWLALSLGIGGISFLGHLGGFIVGILLGLILKTANDFESSHLENKIVNILFIACLAIFILSIGSLIQNILF